MDLEIIAAVLDPKQIARYLKPTGMPTALLPGIRQRAYVELMSPNLTLNTEWLIERIIFPQSKDCLERYRGSKAEDERSGWEGVRP